MHAGARTRLIAMLACVFLLPGFGLHTVIADELTTAAIEIAVTQGSIDALRDIRERIDTDQSPDNLYLRAYTSWRMAQLIGRDNKKEQKSLLKYARQDLDDFLESQPDNAEGLALRSGVVGELITGAFTGMMLGPKVSRDLDKALQIAPENPRVALMRGINFHFTPNAFGGSDEKAEAELLRARDLFGMVTDDGWPNWGQIDALAWLGQILLQMERVEEAVAVFDEALELSPQHNWIQQLRSSVLQAN